jgi:flagellar biosynthesis protein FlhA
VIRNVAVIPSVPESTLSRAAQYALPVAVVLLVAVIVIPLPPLLLDLLISLDVALSLIVLLTAVQVKSPVHFSVFPSMLLLLTVFRLGLNIASTRRILLHGSEGTLAAGHVIEAFGRFVVGGNLVVGLVIFLVILAVQFIVINHGATRISEVAARFTLDAMPGKQMSIDADLNAGLIDEHEARARRKALAREAAFYGSMDGAVRFTQRDAMAALIIVAINLLAGLAIGVLQAHMAATDALQTYATLTVGDGLVTAIPALLVSLAGGLVTTRADSEEELSADVTAQVFSNPKPLYVAASALGAMALIPGLPTVAFLTLAGATAALARTVSRRERETAEAEALVPAPELPAEEPIEPLLSIDPLTVEVGYDLVELVGSERPGGALDRIRGIRRQVALDLGLVVPPVRVRDNLRLASDEYHILLRGAEIGRGRLPRGRSLAIEAGDVLERMEGERTLDPAFGIEALWIRESFADRARSAGYTVVDRTSVLSTHLAELVRRHAPELLGRQETQKLLDLLAKTAPRLVEELVPERYTLGQVQKVLQALLRERVSIRDLQAVAESMLDLSGKNLDLQSIVAHVRQSLGRALVRPLVESGGLIRVVTLSAELEQDVRELLAPDADGRLQAPDPRRVQSLVHRVASAIREAPAGPQPAVLCGSHEVRAMLRRFTQGVLPMVPFLSILEIPDGVRVQAVAQAR